MGVMDKFLNYMKLNDEDDDYYDDDYYDDDDEVEMPPKKVSKLKEDSVFEDRASKKISQPTKISQMRQPTTRRVPTGGGMEVCVIKPVSIEEAREVTETLLATRNCVFNIDGMYGKHG